MERVKLEEELQPLRFKGESPELFGEDLFLLEFWVFGFWGFLGFGFFLFFWVFLEVFQVFRV